MCVMLNPIHVSNVQWAVNTLRYTVLCFLPVPSSSHHNVNRNAKEDKEEFLIIF